MSEATANDSKDIDAKIQSSVLAETPKTVNETTTSVPTKEEGESTSSGVAKPTEGNTSGTASPAWTQKYEALQSSLPPSISSRLPSSSTVQTSLNQTSAKLQEYTTASKASMDKGLVYGKARYTEWKLIADQKLTKEQFFKNAWSVTNETQVVLNVSLNQVGPLMYQVLLPGETFERRVPNVWYALSIRPWTSAKTEHTSWSVTWPIIAVTGPVVAAASLIAIPIAALMTGGSALASLTGIGSAVVDGASATGAAVASGVTATGSAAASAAGLLAKASHLPGGQKVKGKLVEAAKSAVGARSEVIIPSVVKYITTTAAAGGVMKGAEAEHWKTEKDKPKKAIEEIEVTGFDLQKVLRCETGNSKKDKELTKAFENLTFKKHYKTSTNPVLRIVGGPELDERGEKQFLVFYPFVLEQAIDVLVEPVPISEVPPTKDEEALVHDAKIVPTLEEAEKISEAAPVHGDGEQAKADQVDKAVKQVISEHGEKLEKTKSEEEKKEEKKGWFSWRK